MVEVLGCGTFSVSSQMPIEIDVYSDPHSRMKMLVNSVVEIIQQEILNLNSKERDEILQSVYLTMWELKTHEIIENTYIMNKLRDRLDTLKVYNKVVCNCHEDSSLLNIIELVEYLYSSVDSSSTHYYWQRLQSAVYEFMDEFLPHMEEEENTFQPLLCKYFNFEELKLIKETVLEQHRLWKNKVEQEKNLNFFKENLQENEREVKRSTSYCDKLRELEQNLKTGGESTEPLVKLQAETETTSPVYFIPGEILMKILQFLRPRDLLAAGATCRRWYEISLTPRMWKILPLSSWEHGELTWRDESLDLDLVERRTDLMEVNEDEVELDFFSAFSRFIPKIGSNVRRINLSCSSGIQDHQLQQMLQVCVNLEDLDVSYTRITDAGLKGVSELKLRVLNAAGCPGITDSTLKMLSKSQGCLEVLNVSGCSRITDIGLLSLYSIQDYLKSADFSGCPRLSGGVLKAFINSCSSLQPDKLYYCDLIQDGPYPLEANGCQNMDSGVRDCCLKYS